jgi:hypothetical protein
MRWLALVPVPVGAEKLAATLPSLPTGWVKSPPPLSSSSSSSAAAAAAGE